MVPAKRIKMTREHLAYHGAGHAVVGFVLGFVLGEITTGGVGDAHAIVTNPLRAWKRGDGPRREIARRYAVALYAGAAAEKLLLEGAAPWYDHYDRARPGSGDMPLLQWRGPLAAERFGARKRRCARRRWSSCGDIGPRSTGWP